MPQVHVLANEHYVLEPDFLNGSGHHLVKNEIERTLNLNKPGYFVVIIMYSMESNYIHLI